jgi:hypothetical protein
MRQMEIMRRLNPIMPDVLRWSLQRIAQVSRARGIPAVAVVLPKPHQTPDEAQQDDELAAWASEAGLSVIQLDNVFAGYPLDSISFPPPDGHPNARGQRLIADRLFQILRDRDESLLKLGFTRGPH